MFYIIILWITQVGFQCQARCAGIIVVLQFSFLSCLNLRTKETFPDDCEMVLCDGTLSGIVMVGALEERPHRTRFAVTLSNPDDEESLISLNHG